MFLQPPLISYIWNATRDMKLQYLLGLEKFKASGQSLGNLKLPLLVRRYLMYTVCSIADRGLVLVLNYIQCGKPVPGSISGATKQIKTECEMYHEKSFDVLITTTNINRLATAYRKVICNFYTFRDRSPPISLSRPCIYTFFMAILTFWPAVGKLATEPAKIYQFILSKLLSLKEVKKLLRNVFFFFLIIGKEVVVQSVLTGNES